MNDLIINIQYALKRTGKWVDSDRRSEHVFERMQQRGVGVEQIRNAVTRGAKKLRGDGCIIADFRWFRVIYREFLLNNMRKIYPITVEVI